MKILYAKFFQPVQVVRDKNGATDMVSYARDREYNMVVDGPFIKLQPKNGGAVTYVTIYNTCFLRTDNDNLNDSAETSPKAPRKPKTEQD